MSKYKQVEEIQILQTPIQAISEPNFHTALSIAIGLVCEVINWDYGEIWIKSKYGNILELSPARYINPHRGNAYILALEQFRLCSEAFILFPGIGLPGRVWSSQQPEWISDISVQSESYFLRNQIAKAFGVRTGFGVPIIDNDQVVAVLVFFISQTREQDKGVIEIAQAAASATSSVVAAHLSLR